MRLLTFMALIAGPLLLSACGDSSGENDTAASGKAADTAPAGVDALAQPDQVKSLGLSVILPQLEEIVEPVIGTGTIAASQKTNIGPVVTGILEETFVAVGDRVKKGEPLFRVRSTNYEIRVKEAQFQVQLAQAELDNARSELKRIKELRSSGVASKGRLDKVEAQFSIAAARHGIAKASLAKAEQDLDDTIVRAPYDCVVVYQHKYTGEFLTTFGGPGGMPGSGGGGGGGRGVFDISKIDIVAAIVEIPETKLKYIRLGTPGRVYIDGLDQEYPSQVHILNDQVDTVTRKVQVRLAILNPDYAIKPGLFARATLLPDARKTLTLDRRALLGSQSARYVFVHREGKAVRVPVTVRELDARRVEITKGLSENDRVLVGPSLNRVRDGDLVSVEMAHVD